MKYLILISSTPESRALWDTLTDEQMREFGLGHLSLNRYLNETGENVASEGLPDISVAKRVSVRGGKRLITDGPFAEVKEYLAGFYLIDVASEERAMDIAAMVPDAAYRYVEVRPVLDMSQFE